MATWCRSRSSCRGGAVTELFTFWLAGFCTGAAFTGGLAGWFRLRMGPPRGSNGNCVPMPPSTPAPGMRRVYYDMPSTIAECGGPCSFGGPELCDCGALWRDVPTKPQFPSPRVIPGDTP
jgi:hypothetical protein